MYVLLGVFIAIIVWGLVRLAKYEVSVIKRDAVDIFKERYIKGQISKDEFEKIKQDFC